MPSCLLIGKNFYPSKLIISKNIVLYLNYDPGDTSKFDNKQKIIQSYGSCVLRLSEEIKNEDRIMFFAKWLLKNMNNLKKNGVEDFIFDILWTGKQGNMELSHEELSILAKLKIRIGITYDFEEE